MKHYYNVSAAVDNLEDDIPTISEGAVDLLEVGQRVRMKSLDLNDRLDRLRRNVQKTRELTNRVRVGVDLREDTTVEVIPPVDPSESATSTKVSLLK